MILSQVRHRETKSEGSQSLVDSSSQQRLMKVLVLVLKLPGMLVEQGGGVVVAVPGETGRCERPRYRSS